MRPWLFYLLLLIVIGGMFTFQSFVSTLSFADVEIESLTPLQEKQLDLYRESNALLSTLATAAIGGIGALLFNRYKDGKIPPGQRARTVLSVLLLAASLYSGFLSHETVLWMLQNQFFNLTNARVLWATRAQSWCFLLALILFADFFYRGLHTEREDSIVQNAATRVIVIAIGVLCVFGPRGLAAQVRHERAIEENLHVSDEVQTVIQRWAAATGVPVTENARAKINRDFGEQQQFFTMAYRKQDLSRPQQAEFTDAVMDHYLYDLRDRKLSQAGTSSSLLRYGHGVAAGFQTEGTSGVGIDVQDVNAFPPSAFLKRVAPILDNKVGHLAVVSQPDRAQIAIDGDKKPYFTCRTFVISPGDHIVSIIKPGTRVRCSDKVHVDEDSTARAVCPHQAKIRCHLPQRN